MKTINIKDAFYKFKPENCVFVISIDNKENPNGMIAGWNMKCSIDPPLFAISLSKKGNTNKLIRESKEFVIALPNKDLEKHVEFFGSCHGNEIDKFKESGIKIKKSKHIKSPLLVDATINFECRLEKEIDIGDHIIFIGRILESYINKDKKVLINMGKKNSKRIFKEF